LSPEPRLLLRNATVLDPGRGSLEPDRSVHVVGGTIAEVGGPGLRDPGARILDLHGLTLMPGLIDCHVHVLAVTADLAAQAEWSPYYVAARASGVLRGMLDRGFTTVRDAAGADHGLAAAVEEGHFEGPQVIFGGKALSQTGGHGDVRGPGRVVHDPHWCCATLSTVCDGVSEVRRAAREQLRRGAHHLKLMLSGGVASPTDRVDSTQFSREEIRAAVEEAEAANRYVAGHAYTSRAINRGLECGVRTIEHGNLMDESSIPLFIERGAFYVPTLATYVALAEVGREHGLPESSWRKVFHVLDSGLRALELAHRAGVKIAYGTDLLGGMHRYQLNEFRIRSQVQPPADIVRAATTTAAELLGLQGRLGVVEAGARADLLAVEGNPLEDVEVLADPERHLRLVVQGGRVVRDRRDRAG
jgi:imidazolonepropionase-like amidohydrolase